MFCFLLGSIGTSVQAVLSVWISLQIVEVFCVYKEIRSVVFRMLNFERLWIVVNKFLEIFNECDFINGSAMNIALPTPELLARDERIFMPPNHLARRAISFGSLSRAKLSPGELSELINIFRNEKYILVVGKDLKNKRIRWSWPPLLKNENQHAKSAVSKLLHFKLEAQENCHIVLHADANNADIVKSTLALAVLRRKLSDRVPEINDIVGEEKKHMNGSNNQIDEEKLQELIQSQRSQDCMDLIRESKEETDKLFAPFLKVLSAKDWATPARFMFGRVSMRTEWPINKDLQPKNVIK